MEKQQVHVSLDYELYVKLKIFCIERGITMSQGISTLLEHLRQWSPAQHVDNVRAEYAAILAAERAAAEAARIAALEAPKPAPPPVVPCVLCGRTIGCGHYGRALKG